MCASNQILFDYKAGKIEVKQKYPPESKEGTPIFVLEEFNVDWGQRNARGCL